MFLMIVEVPLDPLIGPMNYYIEVTSLNFIWTNIVSVSFHLHRSEVSLKGLKGRNEKKNKEVVESD